MPLFGSKTKNHSKPSWPTSNIPPNQSNLSENIPYLAYRYDYNKNTQIVQSNYFYRFCVVKLSSSWQSSASWTEISLTPGKVEMQLVDGVAWSCTESVYSETRGLSFVSDFGLEKSLTLVWWIFDLHLVKIFTWVWYLVKSFKRLTWVWRKVWPASCKQLDLCLVTSWKGESCVFHDILGSHVTHLQDDVMQGTLQNKNFRTLGKVQKQAWAELC